MKLILRTLLASVLITATGCTSIIAASTDGPIENDEPGRTFGRFIDDEQIETVIGVNIAHSSEALADANVSVVSYNGVVLLVGQVPTNAMRARLSEIAQEVRGVRQVHNQVTVGGEISSLASINDSLITSNVRTRFLVDDSDVDFSDIKVVTENGVVYLMGVVNERDANVAVDIARQAGGVQRIVKVFEYF
jgi:osmotically-inducible protein OsmY